MVLALVQSEFLKAKGVKQVTSTYLQPVFVKCQDTLGSVFRLAMLPPNGKSTETERKYVPLTLI